MAGERDAEVLIIGAGPAGLAVAACLRERGVEAVTILEQAAAVGSSWRGHYERLHLHTDRRNSSLPGLAFPREVGRYPSREEVIAYLERYTAAFALEPRFGERAHALARRGERWQVESTSGSFTARSVVIATGRAATPLLPSWPGQESFAGELVHSSRYRSGVAYRGKDVLVVGFGNSGGEIALDLREHGARPAIAVRGPVNVIPRDLLGIPILAVALALGPLPPRLADLVSAPVLRSALGDIRRYGLRKLPYGPFTQIRSHQQVPLLDSGTLALIRAGAIRMRPELERFNPEGVSFVDGTSEPFAAVIAATGFRPDFGGLTAALAAALIDGYPARSGQESGLPGVFFCGFRVAPTGMLRELGIEARRISEAIAAAATPAGAASSVAAAALRG